CSRPPDLHAQDRDIRPKPPFRRSLGGCYGRMRPVGGRACPDTSAALVAFAQRNLRVRSTHQRPEVKRWLPEQSSGSATTRASVSSRPTISRAIYLSITAVSLLMARARWRKG